MDDEYDIVSTLESMTRDNNLRYNFSLDDLLFELMVESVYEINQDMFTHMTDELLVDFMNFQFEVLNDFSDEILDIIRKDFSDDREALQFFESYIVQEITELNEDADHRTRSNSLRMTLQGAGLSTAAINVIIGAFNVVVATVRAWFTPNVVRAVIIGGALLVMNTVIVLNWSNVGPALTAITNEFVNVARNFARTITNFFTNVRNQARTVFAITIGTVVFFADVQITTANATSFQRPGRFHLALLHNNRIHLTPMDVGRTIAVQALRINLWKNESAEFDTYTFLEADALSIVIDAGNGVPPRIREVHLGANIAFEHFRPAGRITHSWFGAPLRQYEDNIRRV